MDKYTDYETVTIRNLGIEKSYFAAHGYIGALVGKTVPVEYRENTDIEIVNCYSTSTLLAYGSSGIVGGLVGYCKQL